MISCRLIELATSPSRAALSKVNCKPSGNLVIRVLDYRASGGGWLRLTPLRVAGSADVTGIELSGAGQVGAVSVRLQLLCSLGSLQPVIRPRWLSGGCCLLWQAALTQLSDITSIKLSGESL